MLSLAVTDYVMAVELASVTEAGTEVGTVTLATGLLGLPTRSH